ncbi:MAG: SH3 domain-containing protein [Clostridia bacterium]|nr:SH3 domain-containing protein [Clostridia bacterium]
MIAQVTNYVNIRDRASEEGEVVGKLYNNSAGEWLGAEGDWYKIKSGDVSGYVKAEFVVTGDAAVALAAEVGHRTAVVTTTTLKVRQDPSTEATVLGLVPMEDELSVIEETENWVKVSIEEGDGWVSKEFVNVFTDFVHAESKAAEEARLKKEAEERKKAQDAARKSQAGKSSGSTGKTYAPAGSGTGSSVAGFAMQFVGNPYVYGGTSLTNGTDCSGFTMSVYRNFGVSLPHSSGAQRNVGYDVGGIGNAQPGDLVCYSGHVALYIGNGQIVHASTAKTGIKVSNANYRNILAVRRIF